MHIGTYSKQYAQKNNKIIANKFITRLPLREEENSDGKESIWKQQHFWQWQQN